MKEIPLFIERSIVNNHHSKIPRNLIQTFKNNHIHDDIYNNVMKILSINKDFNYYFITDKSGIELLKQYFDSNVLQAFERLNLGSAKGDFLRYVTLYLYGGVYLDLDSGIQMELSKFIDPNVEFIFFVDWDENIQQWSFMVSPKNEIMFEIIQEMVRRINSGESNIFLATGPTLVTDVIYNKIANQNIYNTKKHISREERKIFFKNNSSVMNGLIIKDNPNFLFTFAGFNGNMMYNNNNKKYIVTYDSATPNFYK